MTKLDKLEQTVKRTYGENAIVIDSTDTVAIVRFEKDGYVEYATVDHDYDSIFNGQYYSTMSFSKEEASDKAWDKYLDKRIRWV